MIETNVVIKNFGKEFKKKKKKEWVIAERLLKTMDDLDCFDDNYVTPMEMKAMNEYWYVTVKYIFNDEEIKTEVFIEFEEL